MTVLPSMMQIKRETMRGRVSIVVVILALYTLVQLLYRHQQDILKQNPYAQKSYSQMNLLKQFKSNNSWILLITLNQGFYDFYKNWMWHFKKLDIHLPVVVIAEDKAVYETFQKENVEKVVVERSGMEDINQTVRYNTPVYNKLIARRSIYILDKLRQGFKIIHVDTDTVWMKSPIPFLQGDYDIWIQADNSIYNLCPGFMAIKPNNKTIAFMERWKTTLQQQKMVQVDQAVFNRLSPLTHMNVSVLANKYFPSGNQYFDIFDDKQRSQVVVVHNNFIIGHDKKKKRFQKFGLWKV